MITFKTIASGSSGNCHILSDENTTIMLDCGVNILTVKKHLNIYNVDACFISHVHADHSKYCQALLNSGIDCYVTPETKEQLKLQGHRLHVMEDNRQIDIGSMAIKPFDLVHHNNDGTPVDCRGFLIQSKHDKLVYITDTSYCKYVFKYCSIFSIECNYCMDILNKNIESGEVGSYEKTRLLQSHMNLDNTLDFLRANDLSKCQQIHLLHVSERNGDKERMKREVQKLTGKEVFV